MATLRCVTGSYLVQTIRQIGPRPLRPVITIVRLPGRQFHLGFLGGTKHVCLRACCAHLCKREHIRLRSQLHVGLAGRGALVTRAKGLQVNALRGELSQGVLFCASFDVLAKSGPVFNNAVSGQSAQDNIVLCGKVTLSQIFAPLLIDQ